MVIRDGAYATLLAGHLRSGETVDVLVERSPEQVSRAHRAYIEAGASIIHSPTLMTWRARPVQRRIRYSAAWDVLCDVASKAPVSATMVIGPMGTEPREFWGDLEYILTLGAHELACLTIHDVRTAVAFAQAWHEVAVAGGVEANALLSFGMWDPRPDSDPSYNQQWVQACETIRARGWNTQLDVGLNCGWGLAGLDRAVEQVSAAWGAPVHAAPSAGTREYRYAVSDWAEAVGSFKERADVASVGGCCGTTSEWIAAI